MIRPGDTPAGPLINAAVNGLRPVPFPGHTAYC
jgi:hypothetical protein